METKKENQNWYKLMLKEDLYHSSNSYYISENERRIIKRRRKYKLKKLEN